MIPETKKFARKIYTKDSVHGNKKEARRQVMVLQKHGYYARSIEIDLNYVVYKY